MTAAIEPRGGDARKVVGITPKFLIRDDGTDYTTGEIYNGLWGGGTLIAPTGYGNVGVWKYNEDIGIVAFNDRVRGLNDLFLEGVVRSSDGIGTYVSFKLPDSEPLPSPGPFHFIMMGLGGDYAKSGAFDQFLQTPGFSYDTRYMFDFWAYFRGPPQNDGERQILLALHHETGAGNDHILTFGVKNASGILSLFMEYCNGSGGGTDIGSVLSTDAADLIYPEGLSEDGGLHHIGFILDRTALEATYIKFGLNGNGPEGFYVDGNYVPKTSGDTNVWYKDAHGDLDTNALIGCEIDGNPAFTAPQSDGDPSFKSHFLGKIYQISMTTIDTIGEITEARMNVLHNLKFDIPRGPGLVDFSERFEYKGKNLLQDIGSINQVLESKRGTFHVTISTVKVKN